MGKKRVNPNARDLPPANRVRPVRSTRNPPPTPIPTPQQQAEFFYYTGSKGGRYRVANTKENPTDATIIPRELNGFTFNTADCEDIPRPVGWLPASKWPPHSADALLKANIRDGPCVGRRFWEQDY